MQTKSPQINALARAQSERAGLQGEQRKLLILEQVADVLMEIRLELTALRKAYTTANRANKAGGRPGQLRNRLGQQQRRPG